MPFNKNPPDTHTRVNLTSPGLHSLIHTFLCLLSTLSSLYFYPSSLFLSVCFSLPHPRLSKDSQGCSKFWMLLTSFVHSISSFKLPPCLVFQPSPFFPPSSPSSSLIQCCLLITTEVNIISWSHGQTVDKTQFGLDTQTCQS